MKILHFFLLSITIMVIGCDCSTDLVAELNNGNDDPSVLIINLDSEVMATALRINFGAGCDHPDDFQADVEIVVRTATFIDGQVTLSQDPFFEWDEEVIFVGGNLFSQEIMVPETGAFLLQIEIEMEDCNFCCHGAVIGQCSAASNVIDNTCDSGKPQIVIEQTYMSMNRPAPQFNLNFPSFLHNVRDCRACASCEGEECE